MRDGSSGDGRAGLNEHLTVWPKPREGRGEQAALPPAVRALQSAVAAVLTGPFRQAFDTIPIGAAVLALGERGQRWILAANPALAEMLGEEVEDLPGRDLKEFSHPAPDEPGAPTAAHAGAGQGTPYTREKRYRRADQRSITVELRGTVLDLPHAPGTVMLVTFVDVTVRQQQERHRALSLEVQSAVTELVTRVLAGAGEEEIYGLVVDRVAHLFDAEHVSVMLFDAAAERVEVVAGTGKAHDLLMSGRIEVDQELARQLNQEGVRVLAEPVLDWARPLMGPVAVVRFGPDNAAGLVALGRRVGGEPFAEGEGNLLLTMGQQIALALELGRARTDRERLSLLEERERIARDLHDTVIQDLIAVGIQLTSTPPRPERDDAVVEHLEEAVRRLRGTIFDLHEASPDVGFGEAVRTTAAQVARVLGHRPTVNIVGYFDAVSPPVSGAVLAVLREALSNVARHARATATVVNLDVADDRLELVVEDDGCGLPDRFTPGDGLRNIRERASSLNGATTIAARPTGGTRLVWTCPLPGP